MRLSQWLAPLLAAAFVLGCNGGDAPAAGGAVDARDALMDPPTVSRILDRDYRVTTPGEERLRSRLRQFEACRNGLAGSLRWVTRAAWAAIVETSTSASRPGEVATILSVSARFKRPLPARPDTLVRRGLRRCGVPSQRLTLTDRGRRTPLVQFRSRPAFGDDRFELHVAVVRSGPAVVVVATALNAPARCGTDCADRRLLLAGLRRARKALAHGIRQPSGRPRFGPLICERGRCREPSPPG